MTALDVSPPNPCRYCGSPARVWLNSIRGSPSPTTSKSAMGGLPRLPNLPHQRGGVAGGECGLVVKVAADADQGGARGEILVHVLLRDAAGGAEHRVGKHRFQCGKVARPTGFRREDFHD